MGYSTLLVELSQSSINERSLLVLHDRIGILLVIDLLSIYRCETKRFLANVSSSYRNDIFTIIFLHRQFCTCRIVSTRHPRLCRSLARSMFETNSDSIEYFFPHF